MLPNRWAKRLKMQESAQRSLCRLAFVLFAIIPTTLIVCTWFWSIAPWSQYWTAQTWERRISLNLGVDVQLARVENFAPYSYRFHHVTVKHSETGDLIAVIPSIEFQQRQSAWHLRLQSPKVELEQAAHLTQSIHQRYLCQPNLAFPFTFCSIRDMTLMRETPVMESICLEAQFQYQKDKTSFHARFDLATNDASTSASLDIERHHNLASPFTGWLLQTGGVTIPCAVMASFQSVTTKLGPDATFQGDVRWEQGVVDSRAALRGIFQNVRFQNAPVAMASSGTLPPNNKGSIRVDFAQVMNGLIVQADGLVTMDSGHQSELSVWLPVLSLPPQTVQPASHVDPSVQLRSASIPR